MIVDKFKNPKITMSDLDDDFGSGMVDLWKKYNCGIFVFLLTFCSNLLIYNWGYNKGFEEGKKKIEQKERLGANEHYLLCGE